MADKKIIDIDRLSRYHEKLNTQLATKQDSLVSGDNIKTINGESILGSGNIVIEGNVPDQYKGTVEAIDINEEIDGVSNDFVTSEQLDARDYATKNFVTNKIEEASIGGGSGTDMSNYYTKEDIDNKGYLTSPANPFATAYTVFI